MGEIYDYTILGAGAVGSVLGGLLAESGQKVQLVNRSPQHGDAIRRHGLRLDLDDGARVCHPDAVLPDAVQPSRVVIVLTKTHQTALALTPVLPRMAQDTVFVTLQNGLGNGAALARSVAPRPVLHGVTMLPATMLAPGHVSSHGSHQSWLGALDPRNAALARQVCADLQAAGLDAVFTDAPDRHIWQKACFNVAMNGVCGLIMGSPGLIEATEGLKPMVHALADEALQLAAAEGIGVDPDKVHGLIDFACAEHTYHKPSMLQDIENGRTTEIEMLNGYIVERAGAHAIPVPLNRMILTLMRARQAATGFWQSRPASG